MFNVTDKVIVVTGGKGLLGNTFINRLRLAGAITISADIKADTENEIYLDITNENSVKEAVCTITNKYGRIDGWINNAYPRTPDWGNHFEDISFDSWRKNVDMHLNGYFICCQVVLREMKKQHSGSVINMSSIYGLLGPDFGVYKGTNMTMPAAYAAIKGGITNLTRYLASYYGKYKIRINTVSPGGIFDEQPVEFINSYNSRVPLGRMGLPQDIAGIIHFLMSEESEYITGQNILIDGGWSII